MENQQTGVWVMPNSTTALDVFGIRVDIFLNGQDTNGLFSQYALLVPPGAGVPPHIHAHDDETFLVLEGEFEVLCGDQEKRVSAGGCVFLPRHVPHTFRNVGTAPGRLLATATPAGHERFFEEIDVLTREGAFSPEAALAVCQRHGLELLP